MGRYRSTRRRILLGPSCVARQRWRLNAFRWCASWSCTYLPAEASCCLAWVLQSESGDLERCGGDRMADRRAPEPAVVHRIVLRLLVFELPDQLALCIAESTGDVRVVRDRYQRWMAGEGCAQRDALLLAAAVLQADVYVHIIRIPPA